MKLKKILDYSEARPLASDAALAIITSSLPKVKPIESPINNSILDVFLQTAYQRKRYSNRTLLTGLQEVLNIGVRYNLTLDAPKISLNHKALLPA